MPEAHIAGYGSSLPWRIPTSRFLEVDAEARQILGQGAGTRSMVRQFALANGIRFRHTVCPCWLPEDERPDDVEDIFTPFDFEPPGWLRARFWNEQAPKLAIGAAQKAIAHWGGSPSDITHVVTTCTSGWGEPGISASLITDLGLSLDTQKQELNFNGCYCGATCLRLARDIVRAGDARAVLVVAVETSSIQYDPAATDTASLIASSMFGDGAAAFILSPEGEWRYAATGMSLVPDAADGPKLPSAEGDDRAVFPVFRHRNIGPFLADYFEQKRGSELLRGLLQRCGGQPPALAVHPGGPGIFEAMAGVFEGQGWPEGAMRPSVDTFYDIGHLGAASLPLVMARLLPTMGSDQVATFAFGPGVTVEWALLERA